MEISLLQLFEICNESLSIRIHNSNGEELGLYDGRNSIDKKYNDNIVIYMNPDWDKKELYVELNID
jgi:hypothetical protein